MNCVNCGRVADRLTCGECAACYTYRRRTDRQRFVLADGGIVKPLLCDCGAEAVETKRVIVGANCRTVVHLPLCADCLEMENEMENEYA